MAEHNLVKHARRELELIGEEPNVIEGYLKVVQAFADIAFSPCSATVSISTINDLLQLKTLSPITDDPEEWVVYESDISRGYRKVWQNVRNRDAFSDDGGTTYYLPSEWDFFKGHPVHHSTPANIEFEEHL